MGCISLVFFSLVLFICSGVFSSDTVLENSANYVAEVVKNNTKNKTYCAITVTQTEKSGATADPYNEFHSLYGIFRQERATFGSMYNINKQDSVFLKEINGEINQSIFYLGPVGTIEYKEHYKTYTYPFEVMFEDERMYDISKYVAYVSQSQADSILEARGESKGESGYTEAQYKSLLKTLTPIEINGTTANFAINNIYYETSYYYDCFNEIANDFILMSYYLPVELARSNIYLLNEYEYQNQYFMKYINNLYSNKKFDVKVCKNNINGDINEQLITNFYYGSLNSKLDWVTALFIVAAVVSMAANIYFVWFKLHLEKKALFFSIEAALLLLPYLMFKIIYSTTKNMFIFSSFGTKLNVIFILIFILINIIMFFVDKKYNLQKIKTRDKYEEICI